MVNNDPLMAELSQWARQEARIDPEDFKCRYYDECDGSAHGALWRGGGCQMSYVGRNYGVDIVGGPFRLVVVGIDHGEKGGATFDECRTRMEKYYQVGGKHFNPHYKGVVKTAAAVFGTTGEYCNKSCTSSCKRASDPTGTHCVIDRIAQPNSVKCTPEDTNNRTSRATWPMKLNCAHHLLNEFKVLRPDLVIFHGVDARWIIRPEFKDCNLDLNPIGNINDNYGPVLYDSQALSSRVLFLNHPSHGWLERQWASVVDPALIYMRLMHFIPT